MAVGGRPRTCANPLSVREMTTKLLSPRRSACWLQLPVAEHHSGHCSTATRPTLSASSLLKLLKLVWNHVRSVSIVAACARRGAPKCPKSQKKANGGVLKAEARAKALHW